MKKWRGLLLCVPLQLLESFLSGLQVRILSFLFKHLTQRIALYLMNGLVHNNGLAALSFGVFQCSHKVPCKRFCAYHHSLSPSKRPPSFFERAKLQNPLCNSIICNHPLNVKSFSNLFIIPSRICIDHKKRKNPGSLVRKSCRGAHGTMSEKNVVNDSLPADTSSIPYLMCIGKQVGKEFLWPKIKSVPMDGIPVRSTSAKARTENANTRPSMARLSVRPKPLRMISVLPSARAWTRSRPKPP